MLAVLGLILFIGTGLAGGIQLYRQNLKTVRAAAESYMSMLRLEVQEVDVGAIVQHAQDIREFYERYIEYLEANPNTTCIVSGGQGPNEPFPEAQGMANYLEQHGIAKSRIIQESKSETTKQNIEYSSKLIGKRNASIGVITNDFHMFRALQIAHGEGMPNAVGIAAGSPKDLLANNMLREFFAELKYLVKR